MFEPGVFKKLAHNDTGAAVGHQGGIVIPKIIEEYFPDIQGTTSISSPTVDVPVDAILIVNNRCVGRVTTRYQYQTWGGTRSPERRLTSELGPIRDVAVEDDYMIFQRSIDDQRQMLITLIRKNDSQYEVIEKISAGKRYGVLDPSNSPTSNTDIRKAVTEISKKAEEDFSAFSTERNSKISVKEIKARSAAFRKIVLENYNHNCAVTGISMRTPSGLSSAEAAHIVPVEAFGSDDPRNGILLGKELHWAFDKGLFGIRDNYSIIVSQQAASIPENTLLNAIDGVKLRLPTNRKLAPHPDSLKWHRDRWQIG
ncbi:HNH endonuclease [Hoeflea sp.]|uniref:HNH endonuclease n=1 Tax=Hoeflea sp. TaxID=1940281 RepID=UPI003BB00064